MKQTIYWAVLVFFVLLSFNIINREIKRDRVYFVPEVVIVTKTVVKSAYIKHKILETAELLGVDPVKALQIAQNESGLDETAVGDKKLICERTGKPVRARGIYQITECWHPEVSDKEAFNIDRNIEIGIGLIALNCRGQFSTCK